MGAYEPSIAETGSTGKWRRSFSFIHYIGNAMNSMETKSSESIKKSRQRRFLFVVALLLVIAAVVSLQLVYGRHPERLAELKGYFYWGAFLVSLIGNATIIFPGAVLVLHCPVNGYLDEVPGGVHTGSTGALRIVQKYKPRLVLSGHIHETRGSVDDDGVVYLNPGALAKGYAALVDIEMQNGDDNSDFKCDIQMLNH